MSKLDCPKDSYYCLKCPRFECIYDTWEKGRERAKEMRSKGMGIEGIARELGVRPETIRGWVKK